MLQVLGNRKAVIHTGYIFNIPPVNGLRFMNMYEFYTGRNLSVYGGAFSEVCFYLS